MPRLQDIERFKRDLAALSREEETLARWGESAEDIPPPSGSSDEFVQAFPSALEGRSAAFEQPEEGVPPDFAALLEDLPLGKSGEASSAGGEVSLDTSLAALLGEAPEGAEPSELLSELGIGEGLEEPSPSEAEPEAISEPGPRPGPAEEPASETSAESELESQQGIGQGPGLGPEFEPGSEALEELSSFEFPGLGEEAPTSEGSSPTLPAPEDGAGFELPGLPEGLEGTTSAGDFGQEEGAGFEAAPVSEPGGAEAEPVVASPEAAGEESALPEMLPLEEFSIPDFDLGAPHDATEKDTAEGEQPVRPSSPSFDAELEAPPMEARPVNEPPRETVPEEPEEIETFSFEEPVPAQVAPGSSGRVADSVSALAAELEALGEAPAPEAETYDLERELEGLAGGRAEPARPVRAAAEEKYRAVSLTEAQVDRLQDALLSYPLNLRVAVEDVIGYERGSVAQRSKLIWAMVEGAPAAEAAAIVSRVLHRRVEIPKGFEKRTGLALEAEKGSLGYIFLHTVLPMLRVAALAAALVGALGWLGYKFVYTALAANAAYRSGYQRIAEGRYAEAEAAFAKGLSFRENVVWFYRYAAAYAEKRQYMLAERKYAALVERHPKESKAVLAWARLEREQLKYEEAVKVLKGAPRRPGDESTRGMSGLLSWDYFNKEGLLLLGDVYLDWAEEDPRWYEEARRSYAGLIEHYGQKDEYLERMLLYFIRTGNMKEVRPLERRYLKGKTAKEIAEGPVSATTLAELGGYLLDEGRADTVHAALVAAALKDPSLPESHYHLARYYRRSAVVTEERKALDNAVRTFAALPGLGAKREAMYIDTLIWRGMYRLGEGGWLAAEQDFGAAAAEYERAQELRRLKKSPRFAEAYAGLAEVAYWQRGELDAALRLFERAAADGYDTPDTRYKRGFILYNRGRTSEALTLFYKAGVDGESSPYLEYAFGAALYARGDYFAAEGAFRRVVEAMSRELEQIETPSPQARPSHGDIVELLMRAQNNLGASIYRTAARVGDAKRRSAAMVAFAESMRLFDSLTRDQSSLVRTEARNLGFLNMDFVLHPRRGMDLAIYTEIERDMRFPKRR